MLFQHEYSQRHKQLLSLKVHLLGITKALFEVKLKPRTNRQKLVNKNLLRIIYAFLSYVHALNALDIKPGVNDRAFLKQRLLVKAAEIVGPDIIVDLLFVNIFERPFN